MYKAIKAAVAAHQAAVSAQRASNAGNAVGSALKNLFKKTKYNSGR